LYASRRHFLAASAASAVALGLDALPASPAAPASAHAEAHATTPAAAPRRRRPPPNVVVIAADDLGYGELGAYGQRLVRTPRLDRLAAEGLRFTQAYSAAAVCAPSRASLLTGLHAGHAAVRENPFGREGQGALGEADTTFAELLRARGYRTACFGKWGFGPEEGGQASHPNARGFEEFFGYIGHRHAHEYFPDYLWHNGERVTVADGTYAIDLIEERAVRFVGEQARRAGDERPFLLYLSPNLPHAPNVIPESDRAWADYAAREGWSEADAKHAAQLVRLDRLVGAVVDALRRGGGGHDTLVLFTSDNGPHEEDGTDPDFFGANGGLRGYKRNLYEGGIRVPLIAWQPGTVRAGAVSGRVTSLTDVLPTLAELAGVPVPAGVDGVSAAPLLGGTTSTTEAARPGHLYWYRNEPHSTRRANAVDRGRLNQLAEAVRRDDWKAVRFAPGRDREVPDEEWEFELYDLAADPGETRDVAADHPAVVAELTALLRSSWAEG
jgi:arylsulfatase A